MDEGFIQLGRRSAPQRGMLTKRHTALTLLVINNAGSLFSPHNLQRLREVCASLRDDAEILMIANKHAAAGYEQLLQDFPEVRLLMPVACLSFRQCLWLGMNEAAGELVMVLDPGCFINALDLDVVFRAFQDKDLFALGFNLVSPGGASLNSLVKAFPEQGYLRLLATERGYRAKSFFLRDFLGVYRREKMLLLGRIDRSLHGVWAAADFFLGAWTRGWHTVVDPHNEIVCSYALQSLEASGSFRNRLRFYRNEIGFLQRNFIDPESRRFRKRYMLKTAWSSLKRFDLAPGFAGFLELIRKFVPFSRIPRRYEAVIGPLEVFERLIETDNSEEKS